LAGVDGSAGPTIFAPPDEDVLEEDPPELPQAASSTASGTLTAATSGREILLVTEDYSLGFTHAWGAR
jgi:hypothetical protein